jgi:endonuclease/exonuclease/phosphatase family metal-dependent hydrolase
VTFPAGDFRTCRLVARQYAEMAGRCRHPQKPHTWRPELLFRKFASLALLLAVVPLSGMTGASPIDVMTAAAPYPQSARQADAVSVLTYNVKGLPWPIASSREAAFAAIEQRLLGLRAIGAQPYIVVLQEAFTERAKQIGSRSGYAYRVDGPATDKELVMPAASAVQAFLLNSSALKGETEGKWVDSGLQIFSDYPILSIKRAAFPRDACAGYDCLANKGVLLVEVRVPGQATPVTIVTTHLNSRRAAGVGDARSQEAYGRQLAALEAFIEANHNPENPLIVSGDFNASSPARRAMLAKTKLVQPTIGSKRIAQSGLDVVRASMSLKGKLASEAAYISRRGRDWQFFSGGAGSSLRPVALDIPFGREKDGSSLSDHLGFVINYKIVATPSRS